VLGGVHPLCWPEERQARSHRLNTGAVAAPLVAAAFAHCPTKTQSQRRQIIAAWIKQGRLYEGDYHDPTQSGQQKGLFIRKPTVEGHAP
jgi:hypothetical protein